jgi:ribosomal protein S18 acetylase RimI-like enzyme
MNTPDLGLVVRPYQPADESAVLGLWQHCGLVVPWNDSPRDIPLKLQVHPELFLVGTVDGRIVATVMAGYDGHRGHINYLGVDPELRRRGIGREMMAHAEALLRERGCPKINLLVRTSNQGVIAFYERLGYKVDEVVSMGKRLN